MARVFNFSAGPSALPEEVLKEVKFVPVTYVDEVLELALNENYVS